MAEQSRTYHRRDGTTLELRIAAARAREGAPEERRLHLLRSDGSTILSVPLATDLVLDRMEDEELEQMVVGLLGECDEPDMDGSESGFGELDGG